MTKFHRELPKYLFIYLNLFGINMILLKKKKGKMKKNDNIGVYLKEKPTPMEEGCKESTREVTPI